MTGIYFFSGEFHGLYGNYDVYIFQESLVYMVTMMMYIFQENSLVYMVTIMLYIFFKRIPWFIW